MAPFSLSKWYLDVVAEDGETAIVYVARLRLGRLETIGKALYGAVFVIALPTLLVAWARAFDASFVHAHVYLPLCGAVFVMFGASVMVAGWWALGVYGGGLPMNALPPPRYATRGIYAWLSHPVYVGFCAVVFGASLVAGSAAGVYLITPTVVLACTAIVLGHERHDLIHRFGTLATPRMRLPVDDASPPNVGERAFA